MQMTPPPDERETGAWAPAPRAARLQTGLLAIIAFGIVLFLLVQAQFVLIPLVIAIILFSLTSEAINAIARLKVGRFHIPSWLASFAALALIAAGLMSLSAILLTQANTVLMTTLAYADQGQQAIGRLFAWISPEAEAAALNAVQTIEISGYLRTLAGQAGSLVSATVLIILFVGFLFAERVWFDTKLQNLFGNAEEAARAGAIIGSIMKRVNHYLLVKTVVSAATGAAVWMIARVYGLDLAVALAILTFVLNFIPNLGSIAATGVVALVAYVQLGDPADTLAIFLLTTAVQFGIGNVVEPVLMGRALQLSSFGIIISLAFWGAVWGLVGMFLAVPIMVAMMIVCSHIPALRPAAVLLSREGLPDTRLGSGRG